MSQDAASFHQLYKQYAKDVYRFSYWLCGDPDTAKDITSETFVRIWNSENEMRFESVKGYLFTIARHLYLREKQRQGRLSHLDESIADTAGEPDQVTEHRADVERAMKAIQSLPEIDRTVLLMRAEKDLPYEEIAHLTGLSVSAAKVKVFRVRARLHSLLQQ